MLMLLILRSASLGFKICMEICMRSYGDYGLLPLTWNKKAWLLAGLRVMGMKKMLIKMFCYAYADIVHFVPTPITVSFRLNSTFCGLLLLVKFDMGLQPAKYRKLLKEISVQLTKYLWFGKFVCILNWNKAWQDKHTHIDQILLQLCPFPHAHQITTWWIAGQFRKWIVLSKDWFIIKFIGVGTVLLNLPLLSV